MDYLLKAILFLLLLSFHCTDGYVNGRHEIVRREVNVTEVDGGLRGALTMLFQPLADLAAKLKLEIPLISNSRTKNFN
ncbi:uncharacterized protein LOC6738288 [Drosophila simulans]|uniref:GD14618 n=1 Tax=Drosophila simulans TaxID=7240 RepID=B4QMB5_DROSI|nr:uncharacterized protein LOC6738288 [Drosophila simulans]EDX10684.1 GD14618 [Drosophila simulans]KMY99998.1 uncharacterized protein Dsimw501_GD14618 [Drosophila simulans]